jgi:hypothetical protein
MSEQATRQPALVTCGSQPPSLLSAKRQPHDTRRAGIPPQIQVIKMAPTPHARPRDDSKVQHQSQES